MRNHDRLYNCTLKNSTTKVATKRSDRQFEDKKRRTKQSTRVEKTGNCKIGLTDSR